MKKTKFTALLVLLCMLVTQMTGIIPAFASSMSFDNGTISIDWEGESTNATLITAEYDANGVLSQLKTYDENLNTGTNNIGTDYLNAGTKVMLWDSTSNMKPLMNAYCVSGSEITSLSVDDTYQLLENNDVSTMSVKNLQASYSTSENTGVITIAAPSEDYQKTLMVLKPGTDKTNVSAADIIAIDQGEDISQVRIPALDYTEDAGVYTVLMGGTSGDIYMGTFTIGAYSVESGNYSGLDWNFDSEGVLTISGNTFMNYEGEYPWKDLNITSVVIEEGVYGFFIDAFSGSENLKDINISSTVSSISYCSSADSFDHNGNTEFKVNENNTSYASENGVLYNKNKTMLISCLKDKLLSEYTVPDTVVSINKYAFVNCRDLREITLGRHITSIGLNAFSGADALSKVYYTGSSVDWDYIAISSGNDSIRNAEKVYSPVVSYHLNGGRSENVIDDVYFSPGEEVTITSVIPRRDQYKFLGWAEKSDATAAKYTAGESVELNANAELYAIWSPYTYEITFVTNSDEGNIVIDQGYETKIQYILLSRTGYRFDGWYKDEDLTQETDITVMPAKNLTFYAKWTAVTDDAMKLLWSCGFEEIDNCYSEENGDEYSIMPSLANGDISPTVYSDIDGITLSTCKRGGDDSSYFRIDMDDKGDLNNGYLTTSISRFSTTSRGSKIQFDSQYNASDTNDLIFIFDIKMRDADDSKLAYDDNFALGNTVVTREMLGAKNDEWTKVMAVYSTDKGMKLYRVNGNIAYTVAEDAGNTQLSEMVFNSHASEAVKSSMHPYGYPTISLDNIYLYTVKKDQFSLAALDNLEDNYKYRLKKTDNLQWIGTMAKWDSVPCAEGYRVSLMRNGNTIKTVENVKETSYDFGADMKSGCTYRFKVTAVSDDYYDGTVGVSGVYSSADISVGDYVQMGKYYDEPILWRCIDVDENGPMLITDKILCVKSYDAPGNITTGSHTAYSDYSAYWGDSNLRCWLNSDAEAGKVVWTCGNPPSSKALDYDAYDDEAGFLSNFSATEKYVINPASRNNGAFTDKVTLLDMDELNIFKYNKDILGAGYKIGILSDKAVENSEYLKTISHDFDNETQTEIKYNGGDKYDTYYLQFDTNYVNYLMSSGGMASTEGGVYCGVRPAIHIKDGFELTGEGTETEPYSIVDDIAAKVSLPENDVTPKIYDIIKIPVNVSENTGFASAAVSLSYDTDKYTFISVTPGSSLLGATITKSETNDGVNILAVNPSNITGDGTIFTVNLMVNVDALNTTSEITVKPVEFFDENQKLLVIDTGNAKMQSILSVSGDIDGNTKVNSADAVLLSQYLAKYQSSSLSDTQKNNADVYTDSKINIKDIYVLSQYIVNNLTSTNSVMSLFAEDNPKLSVSAKYADNDNSMIDVTFSVKDNSGFTSFLFEMGFDKTRLTPVSITSDDILKNESITSNVNETGVDLSSLNEVTALLNKSEGAVESDGKLYTVRFKINGELADDDVITFKNSGFISKVNDIQLDAPTSINLKEMLNIVDEPQNEVRNLKADAEDGQVTLSWDKNDNALAYVIYQDGAQKQTVLDTSCVVTGLNNGIQYTFTVKILSSSGMSEGVSVTAVPLLAIPPSDDNVHITYNNGTANILSDYGLNNVVVIFAEYDTNDLLVSVESKSVTVAANTPTNYSKDKVVGDGNKVKVMLWNSLEEMQPLHSVVE